MHDSTIEARPTLPLGALALMSVAMLPLLAGACGLVAPDVLPLALPAAPAWGLVGLGLALDGAGVAWFLAALRRR